MSQKIELTKEQIGVAIGALEPIEHLFRTRRFRDVVSESLRDLRVGKTPNPESLEMALTATYESRHTYLNEANSAAAVTGLPVRDFIRERLSK